MSSSGDSLLTFINGDTTGENPIVNAANPVNWGRLGQSIGLSVITALVAGVTNIINAIGDALTSIFGGYAAFLSGWVSRDRGGIGFQYEPGLFDVLVSGVLNGYGAAFDTTNAWLGVLALPVNVGIVLLSVYILSVGLQGAASRLFGGG